ncbi:MAG: MBL fold metallo-hydrolase [Clostridia bacterium]|nr:MBL fold metallo-hydrolase [Clostridia bacterium]
MKIECYGGRGYESNCYLIMDDGETHALVLDPSVDFHTVFRQRGKSLPPIDKILLSHAHFDHMLAVDDWREKTGAPLAVHEADAAALGDGEKNVYRLFTGHDGGTAPAEQLLREGDTIAVGDEYLTVLHTPGHTPGCMCLYAPGILLSGDTLFAGDIGRSDLPGGRTSELMASLRELGKLPPDTKVYPGHGPQTTIEREKKYNPYIGE